MNRNIEVGCLVMIISADKGHEKVIGACGTAMQKASGNQGVNWTDSAGIDRSYSLGEEGWLIDLENDSQAFIATRSLIRIDNHDTSADEIERDMEMVK